MAAYWILHSALIFLSITSQQVLAARQHHRHTISVQSLLSSSMCSSPSTAPVSRRGSTLQIVRRACLQTGGDHKTVPDHHQTTAMLQRDRHRVRSIHRRLTGAETTIPARLGLAFDSLEYVVTIGIGTPARNLTVLFDTGSDLTWVQCLPCTDTCYPQEEPLFDPSKSTTYVDVPCGVPECQIGGGQHLSCAGTSCQYSVEYGDESVTRGNLAEETFALSPLAPPATGVVFGCSQQYSSGIKGAETGVAGLLGLGRGDSSILSQTRQGNGGGVFSYCLSPRGSSTTGYLTIGAAAPRQSNDLSFTPLITTSNPHLSSVYVVSLTGVSVSGAALPVGASDFDAGTVIDSGTVLTYMPSAAYYLLRDEFRRHMGAYKMLPDGYGQLLDTCYDVTGLDVVTAPRVALEFGGTARIDVDKSGILLVFEAPGDSGTSVTLACLPFVPTDSLGFVIVGNMQQRAYDVVFDMDGGRIGFGPNGCS